MRGAFDPKGDVRRILGSVDLELTGWRARRLDAHNEVSRAIATKRLDDLLDERLLAMRLRGSLG